MVNEVVVDAVDLLPAGHEYKHGAACLAEAVDDLSISNLFGCFLVHVRTARPLLLARPLKVSGRNRFRLVLHNNVCDVLSLYSGMRLSIVSK